MIDSIASHYAQNNAGIMSKTLLATLAPHDVQKAHDAAEALHAS